MKGLFASADGAGRSKLVRALWTLGHDITAEICRADLA